MLRALFAIACLSGALAKNGQKVDCGNSTAVYSVTGDDDYAYINCQNDKEWKSMNITITTTAKTGLALHLISLQNLLDGDELKIYSVVNDTETMIHEGVIPASSWMPTGMGTIRVTFDKTAKSKATISMKVYKDCKGTFGLPVFVSPVVPSKGIALKSATCTFNVTVPSYIEFQNFSLSAGSSFNFLGPSWEKYGPITENPHKIFVAQRFDFSITLNLTEPKQEISFTKTEYSGSVCGDGMIDISAKPTTVSVKGGLGKGLINCVWAVQTKPGQVINLNVTQKSLVHVRDLVSAVDSGNFTGKILMQLSATTPDSPSVISSGSNMVISFSSEDFDDKTELLSFSLNSLTSGGSRENEGKLPLQTLSQYDLMATDSNKSIHVNFGSLGKLEKDQVIEVYLPNENLPLVKFDKDHAPFDISSPGSSLRVVSKQFGDNDNKSVDFMSIPRGSGCSRTFISSGEDEMKLLGNCSGQATWLIAPQDGRVAMFLKVLPKNVKTVSISKTDMTPSSIIEANATSEPFVVTYAAAGGAIVRFEGNNFQMSYSTKDLVPYVFSAENNANITLSSPLYPGLYPQKSKFEYSVVSTTPNSSYLASFKTFDLLQGHTLTMTDGKGSLQVKNNPADVLIPASFLGKITFDTISGTPGMASSSGFSVNLIPTADARTFTEMKNEYMTLKKCEKLRCVYIVNLPLDGLKSYESMSVNLTVAAPPNSTLPALSVWDGTSILRNDRIAPVVNKSSSFYASKSNQIIISYEGSVPLNISYVSSKCSNETDNICLGARLCAPLSWHCNGIPECPDGSDEFNCKNGPRPTPPPPTPVSSSGWKTAFWIFMPIFILLGVGLTKGLPIAVQRMRDSRYQQFHDLGEH